MDKQASFGVNGADESRLDLFDKERRSHHTVIGLVATSNELMIHDSFFFVKQDGIEKSTIKNY